MYNNYCLISMCYGIKVAEGERFELSIPVKACRFSRPVHSTALPTLRSMFFNELAGI